MKTISKVLAIIGIIGVIAVGLFASGAVYVVNEYEQAVITRFGEVQYAVVTGLGYTEDLDQAQQVQYMEERYPDKIKKGAGLYFKVPFMDVVHKFDSRILDWNGEEKNISTLDLRTLVVDSSARWRILNPIRFYESVGTQLQADNKIGGVIGSQIEDEISRTRLIEVVRNSRLELEDRVQRQLKQAQDDSEEGTGTAPEQDVDADEVRYGRAEMVDRILSKALEQTRSRFGVELVDVLITRINYTESVRQQVYKRMIAERQEVAAKFRSEGERIKRRIQGDLEDQRQTMLSEAERQIRQMIGSAESEAINVWADAYSKNPEFFRFRRSLETYEEGLKDNGYLILSDDNDLLEQLTTIEPESN